MGRSSIKEKNRQKIEEDVEARRSLDEIGDRLLSRMSTELNDIPDETRRFIKLACDPNLQMVEIEDQMGWERGHGTKMLKKFPMLRQAVEEGRILAMRSAGIEKMDAYKVYKNGMTATGVTKEGHEYEDHRTRIMAADRVLNLLGESPLGKNGVEVKTQSVVVVNGMGERLERALSHRFEVVKGSSDEGESSSDEGE